ncbi:Ig-like domain-containing protein [Thalassospira xianhensis]|uniref:Peptidoglycan-binding protein n=1 Tax=Thalassospira xianhensis MCCC 1A02616 TaxID=1177929 RepID=A0A367UDG6_9PROT|nr:Ig-like domain-containing protein [Thalassospira xianhensis]RCK06020.1 peptidoglycan-binding protein [Thalassospira xianhensis MCCC 1A02616]
MKRPYILVIIGVLLIVAAISLNYMLTQSVDEADTPARTTAPPAVTPDAGNTQQAAPEQTDAAPEVRTPSFDVVRIGPDGNAVIAGRAAPNSTVRIREGDEVIGQATADERGEWVVLPEKPLASGDRELSLESEDSTGEIYKGDDNVVVLIPEKPASGEAATAGQSPDDAAKDGDSAEQPIIAMRVPKEGGAATVLQGPAPEDMSKETARELAQAMPQGSEMPAATGEQPAAAMPRLSIDVVDYDEEGRVAMSGKADDDTSVRVYLDNKFVGSATTGEDGNWALTIGEPIEPGQYQLRADQLDPSDKVTARVELPFERARPDQILEPGSRYVVQPGNSLWRIARRTYGDGLQYWVIYNQNRKQIRDPDLIYPGQIFALPENGTAQQ